MLLMDIVLRIMKFHRVGCDFVMPLLAVRPHPPSVQQDFIENKRGVFWESILLDSQEFGLGLGTSCL